MNPLARKRWNRFRRHRRGFYSMCLLLGLYGVSLFAEFICNDRPLYVRYEGRTYFPALKFYPDDTFTGSGLLTRPDYKLIRESDRFRANPDNRMVFAPFPNGPYEIIRPETLRDEEQVEITLVATPRVGSVNVDGNLAVTRSMAADYFLPMEGWALPVALQETVAARMANREMPAYSAVVTNLTDANLVAELSMSRFQPRSRPPRDVRLTFREVSAGDSAVKQFVFNAALELTTDDEAFWLALDDATRDAISSTARLAHAEGLSVAAPMVIDGVEYAVRIQRNDVQWPFRPAKSHWMGIDNAGRDVFARILYGLRTSMTFGLLLVGFSMGFGIIMGALQGYYGGKVDLISQRIIEIWSTIPFLYVMILLGSMYGRSFSLLLFCYGIFNWIGISYYVRAEFLRLRNTPFVDAARCLGISAPHIMFRHILPNALTPIITFFPFSLVGAIGSLAILDYLGFGLPPPTPSWGELQQQAQAFRWAWWLILYPSLALFVVMLLGVFMGEGVRDAYDPKPVMRME
ncbi:MAG: ABC transporter permease subunit [Kiritimatiellia bacterium]